MDSEGGIFTLEEFEEDGCRNAKCQLRIHEAERPPTGQSSKTCKLK